ncbi:hypothetical protein Tco_1086518 [Tanacetum coccineum]
MANLKATKDKSEEKLKRLTPTHLKAQEQVLTEIETEMIQPLNNSRDEYLHYIIFRDDQLPITKFNYKVSKTTKIATMRITRNNQPLNYKIFDDFKLKMAAEKLGITPPPQLNDFELPPAKRKRKRKAEIVKEVFVSKDIVVDGMHRNLTLP